VSDKFGGLASREFDSFEEADDFVKFVVKGPARVCVNGKWYTAHGSDLFIPLGSRSDTTWDDG
jgi:hypothetical protein